MRKQYLPSTLIIFAVVTLSFVFIIVTILYMNILSIFYPNLSFIRSLENYQTLVAGLLALSGALASVIWLQKQIWQVDDHADDVRRRKSLANRSVLPLVLSNVCDYASELANFAVWLYGDDRSEFSVEKMQFLSGGYPYEYIDILKNCVENADKKPRRILSALIRRIQFTRSRVKHDLNNLTIFSHMIEDVRHKKARNYLRDAVYLYATANHMFDYADGKTEDLEPNILVASLKTALHVFWTADYSPFSIALRNEVLTLIKDEGDHDILQYLR